MTFRQTLIALACATAASAVAAAGPGLTGPSTTESPYVLPSQPGVQVTSLLTVADQPADNGYRMVGIPDGLAAFDRGDGTLVVLMNHELRDSVGVVRAHGATGAFVSQWVIRKSDLRVLGGQDMVQSPERVFTWAGEGWQAGSTAFSRLCSADMAPISAFYNPASGKGYKGRLLLNGEETGAEGRAFAWVVQTPKQGEASVYQLPALGRASWENWVASPAAQDKTVALGTDDTSVNGQVYVYVGDKRARGNPVERAGLHGGKLYAVKAHGSQSEDRGDLPFGEGADGRFSLVDVSDVAMGTGEALNGASIERGATNWLRPEDAAWSTKNPREVFMATTDNTLGRSRIWALAFDDIAHPEAGGTLRVAGDGNDGFLMADNIGVDARGGQVLLQEDVGNNPHLGRILGLDAASGALRVLGEHDPARFLAGGAQYLTQDEESSGIIDVTRFFRGVEGHDAANNRYYLFVTQAHYAQGDPELVEGGQLQLMRVPNALAR